MRDKITPETFPSLWGITLPCLIGGAPAESWPALTLSPIEAKRESAVRGES
jgi:hypothetical protein